MHEALSHFFSQKGLHLSYEAKGSEVKWFAPRETDREVLESRMFHHARIHVQNSRLKQSGILSETFRQDFS